MFRFCSQLLLISLYVASYYGYKSVKEKVVKKVLSGNGNKSTADVEGKIVGGKAVSLRDFPSVALFFNMRAMCAATILNSWTVMTAAHCFDHNTDKDDMEVEVGARYLYDFNAKQHEVDYFVVHNKYNISAEFACDIALIFVKMPIKFSDKIKKAIIANTNSWMNPREKHFKATGWGWTKYGGPQSEDGLLMAELEYVSSKTCGRLHQIALSPDMFCLYGNATKDTCKGDSGGSILWNNMVVGITSHGDGCAKKRKPSIFINVWYFRKWIKEEIRKFVSQFCIRHKNRLKKE